MSAAVASNIYSIAPIREAGLAKSREFGQAKKEQQPPEPPDMEIRLAKLEAWSESINATLDDMKQDIRELRGESRALRGDIHVMEGSLRKDMREDFRLLFGALIVVALGLAGLMAKGFGWL